MLLCEAARPTAGKIMFQSLGFAYAREWISKNRFDNIEGADRNSAVGFNPVAQVLPKLRMENRFPASAGRQVPTPGAISRRSQACLCPL
jgi:hypothetical protein